MQKNQGVPIVAKQVRNPANIHEDAGLTPGSAQWLKDMVLLWLWYRPSAEAPIQPLAWEIPDATGVALKRSKKRKKKKIRTDVTSQPREKNGYDTGHRRASKCTAMPYFLI